MSITAIKDEVYSSTNQIGRIIYNGVTLNPTTQYSLESSVVMDDARRVVKYTRYTLTGRFVIWGAVSGSEYTEANCSTKMASIRERLQLSGRELLITGSDSAA